jgi:hypothetical protein
MTLQEIKVRDQEEKIRKREVEVHNRVTKKREWYKSTGYISEDAFLGDCMEWMRLKYPFLKDFVFHIPNEGYSGNQEAKIFASMNVTKGVLKGVPDVLSVWAGNMIWSEFKLPDGVLSDAQIKIHERWKTVGIQVARIDTFERWVNWIEKIVL